MTRANPLPPTWDRKVPTYPNEESDHLQTGDGAVVTLPPISVQDYMSCFKGRWNVVCCTLLPSEREYMSVLDRPGELCNTRIGAWARRLAIVGT